MKLLSASSVLALLVSQSLAADLSPKDEVLAAAKKLGESASYTWHTVVAVPDDAQFKPGPTDGKTEKDGFTHVKLSFFGNDTQIVKKGAKGAVTNMDGDWQATTELEGEGPGQFMKTMVDNLRTPAVEASDLAKDAKELKKVDGVIAGDLTEQGAKNLFRFGNAKGAVGSVKFWLKDGVVMKYEFKAKGTVEFGENEFPVDRTTTVEIKDIGTTKVEAPEAAKKKVS